MSSPNVIIITSTAEHASLWSSLYKDMLLFQNGSGLPATDPRLIVAHLIRVALSFIGLIFLLLILSAGFQWMVSGGDEERVKKAKSTLFNAIIGLIIIFSAYSIVQYVMQALGAVTGNSAGATL